MNRKPIPPLPQLLLALLLAGGASPLHAIGPASTVVPAKPKSSNPKPAVESVAPAAPEEKPEPAAKLEVSAKPEIQPDEQAPEAIPRRKDRGGLFSALKARKEESQRQKAEKAEASAIPENPGPTTGAKPAEIEPVEPKKSGFFASVFKKRPRHQPGAEASGEAGKPEKPEGETSTSGGTKAEAPIPEVQPKRRGFHPPWSQRKESPESEEALATSPDVPPGEKTKRRGFRWPWSQRKEAPVMEEAPAPETEPRTPSPAPFDPAGLLDIKPREPETGLAPSAAPTPPGKKPNPLDDIGLHPER